jgi:ubiquinone/menaquinone biosynthesis C-methylase UbiE
MPRTLALLLFLAPQLAAQESSVKPGINDPFKNPDLPGFVEKFEGESREIFAHRKAIVAACKLTPGQTVADIGAGTGLFTRLFAEQVGPKGKVFAVDITPKFLDHIRGTAKAANLTNIETVLCTDKSCELKPDSVDLAFICDTYHHFEFPQRTMATVHAALKPGGRLVLIDFKRIKGESSEWTMGHVRAGQEVFEREVTESGFRKTGEVKGVLKDNYLVTFEKVPAK